MSVSITTPASSNAAVFFSRRRASEAPLSPSAIPDLAILPKPYASDKVRVGQLVSADSKHDSNALEDRDYDDAGSRWYKDVISIDEKTGRFVESYGGVLYLPKPADAGTLVGTIEAREMRVRLLKDENAALQKVLQDAETAKWVKNQAQKGDVGFVTAVRGVINASYKHANLVDRGANSWEVVREVGGEGRDGKRRDSGLDVPDTGSKEDVVGVVVKKIIVDGSDVKLGEEIGAHFWN